MSIEHLEDVDRDLHFWNLKNVEQRHEREKDVEQIDLNVSRLQPPQLVRQRKQ